MQPRLTSLVFSPHHPVSENHVHLSKLLNAKCLCLWFSWKFLFHLNKWASVFVHIVNSWFHQVFKNHLNQWSYHHSPFQFTTQRIYLTVTYLLTISTSLINSNQLYNFKNGSFHSDCCVLLSSCRHVHGTSWGKLIRQKYFQSILKICKNYEYFKNTYEQILFPGPKLQNQRRR